MQVWNLLHAARCKYRTQKIAQNSPCAHRCTTLSGYIFPCKACIDDRKKLVKQQYLLHMPYNMVNFGPLTAVIGSGVWGTQANFNGFRVLAALLHDTPVLGVSQTLRRWTEGATYIRQGDHHVGQWPTFYTVFQKSSHLLIILSEALWNLNRFSKFLHSWKVYEICYQVDMTLPPHFRHVATVPWEIKNSNFLQMWKKTGKLFAF